MRPSFIRECVEYAHEVMSGKKVFFNITTNAVPVTPGIAEFLFENGFSVMASIDGPAVYHDKYRVDAEGKGSFDRTIRGLKLLAEAYRKAGKGHIALSMVYTPPYSEEKIDAIDCFLKELDWLPDTGIQISYPSDGSIPMDCVTEADLNQDKDLMQWAFERYRKDYGKSNAMVKGVIEKRFAKLMQRPVLTRPVDYYSLNGCCVPGQRKNYISTSGSIYVCEKISTSAPVIGHVETGFYYETIKNVYIDGYAEKSMDDCSGCWGLRLCDICYTSAFNEKGEPDFREKKRNCGYMLKSLERSIRDLSTLLEENPEEVDYLFQYEVK